jgi:SAM-dependent methyltransferase
MWTAAPEAYYPVGLSALDCIHDALAVARCEPRVILDLPSGHGRVCRMLRAAFPDAHITACDLNEDGVAFCAREFGAEPLVSRIDVENLELPREYDLIWCGSLLTHLDRSAWPEFLRLFLRALRPGGVVVWTTHGRSVIERIVNGRYSYGLSAAEQGELLRQYRAEGFGFVTPEGRNYSLSLSSLAFVGRQVEQTPGLQMVAFHEAGWANHHDVVSCVRMDEPFPDAFALQ